MNMRQRFWRKTVASTVIFSMIFPTFMQSVHAASTDISDIPVAVKSRVKPNIIMSYDDSGSMDSEVLMPTNDGAMWWHTGDNRFFGRNASDTPDYNAVTKTGTLNFNSAGNADGTWQKFVNLFPNGTATGARVYTDGANDHYAIAPTAEFAYLRSPDFNPIYYNPTTTYSPWPPGHDGTTLVTYANATPTAARSHPAYGTGTFNLTVTRSSTAANETFRMFTGMTMPAGAQYRLAGAAGAFTNLATTTVIGAGTVAAGEYDVNVPYYPATYYLKDPTGTDATAPDGSKLKKYTILATDVAQMQNFANWFTYYRKRKTLMSAAVGNVFGNQKDLRMGVSTFTEGAANSGDVTMYDFNAASDASNAKRLVGQIYAINGSGGTPTKQSLDFVGRQFMRTDAGAPVQFACQFNAAFVFTDGYANLTNPPTAPGNEDAAGGTWTTQYGNANSFPYADGASDTIADIAMKYYRTTLRTGTGFPAGKVPLAQDDTGLPESGPDADRNTNLHMLTYGMGLGVKGTIFGTGSAAALNPYAAPGPDWTTVYPYANRSPKSVDDLWHATLNGRGDMVSARNAAEAQAAVQAIIDRIKAKDSGAAAVAVANANVVAGDNASYASTYKSNFWSGDLKASPIDLATGQPNELTPIWTAGSAGTQLNAAGITAATRKIASYSGLTGAGQGIQFQPVTASTTTKLSAVQQTLLNSSATPPGPTDGAAVVAYLRGDRSGEPAGIYRTRRSRLGDIINAEPVVVREPFANYTDVGYSAFKSSKSGRTRVVLQGANDGMLHAFNTTTGAEEWAYVPNLVMGSLNNLSQKSTFAHKFYVDGTPVVSDVDLTRTGGTSTGTADWRTMVVGGLGKGGRGYYALDVTSTTAASEADVASKVLWEFPNSATTAAVKLNIGYSFGRPIIAKTQAEGWVVLVASGYNNGTNSGDSGGDGQGYLFVLNAKTGELVKAIATGAGSVTTPSGLAHISAFVESDDYDRTVEAAYGGDTLGNVWRFDLTGNNKTGWSATRLATLVDSAALAQPISSEPELASVNIGGGVFKRFVYVGTGRFLGDSDVPGTGANANASQTQTMYGLVDDLTNSPLITPLRSSLQAQTFTVSGTTRTASGIAVNYSAKKGWYIDLPTAGERANTNPALALGALAFTTNIPSTDPCNLGGTSYFNVLDFKTGGFLTGSTVAWSSISLGDGLASRAVLIKLPTGDVKALARKSDGTTMAQQLPLPPGSGATKRKSWRELVK